MVFLVRLLVALVLVGVLLAVAPETAQLAKPNCPDHCGNVSIPYPFGLQSDCSLNKDFLITCNTTDSTPHKHKYGWRTANKEPGIRTLLLVRRYKEWTTYWLRLSKFRVSSRNKFTVVGCDSYAYLLGSRAGLSYSAGCMSTCDSIKSVYTKSCTGSGCCQIEIPDELSYTDVTAYSFNNHTKVRYFNPCTYAFVVENGKFNFSSEYLEKIPQDINFTMLLEWSIEKAGDHKLSSACKDNATSYNLDVTPNPQTVETDMTRKTDRTSPDIYCLDA
uniref:Wall-associated receptor kinase galacturonan-binding domain-containing protein n=1 Tax=Manihot esculenta TaxID=3983 RepID=A0A2C9WEQ1_MANES